MGFNSGFKGLKHGMNESESFIMFIYVRIGTLFYLTTHIHSSFRLFHMTAHSVEFITVAVCCEYRFVNFILMYCSCWGFPFTIRGWSENFSASTIDGNTIGKIFF